ncbi:response regulator [Erythrobacter sp. KY5]|uniref:response regulator n=1 Tax=Erythrobacter sp. KY5 TaxID=2011159 RepID=UPI000DBF0AB2|nr:response regulator [Erythrobacter sp. KY5]AWW75378.1 response regulator [Erythrobacter sp. KY5]
MTHKILVAEDEMIVAFDLIETVEEAGFEVDGPHAGVSSAMLAYQKEKPALAIFDIQLQDGNALELARTMMEEDVPVVFYTGSRDVMEVAEQFPNSYALAKPCPPSAMLSTISEALEFRSAQA